MKKIMKTFLALAMGMCIIPFSNYKPALADAVISENVNNSSFRNYVDELFKYKDKPEFDTIVLDAFEKLETMHGANVQFLIYEGDEYTAIRLTNYLKFGYGMTTSIRPKRVLVKVNGDSSKQRVYLTTTTSSVEEAISDYKVEAEKARVFALALKRASNDETISNILNWVSSTVIYDYSDKVNDGSLIYGAYNGIPVRCEGFATTTYQLCAINGIPCSVITMIGNNGYENHAANQIQYSDGKWYYVEPQDGVKKDHPFWVGSEIAPYEIVHE